MKFSTTVANKAWSLPTAGWLVLLLPMVSATCMNDFMCPEKSKRRSGRSCYDTFDDCECIPGYYKHNGACKTDMEPECDLDCVPFSYRKTGRGCYNNGRDCICIPGYSKSGLNCVTGKSDNCNKECPANSKRKNGPSCFDTFDDCECDYGFKKHDGMCVFDNDQNTYPGMEPACNFFCPANSYPDPAKTCVASIDDCLCVDHYHKNGDMCACENTYNCPSNSHQLASRKCYNDFDDCECDTGYVKDETAKTCVSGTAQLPPDSWTRVPLPVQTYYIPLPEDQIMTDTFQQISSGASGNIHSTTAISIGVSGTVLWFDDKEDGFEADVTADTIASSTKVWGDGNLANGCAPNHSCLDDADDFLEAGDIVFLENEVNPSSVSGWNGGDRIKASYPIAMTRGEYPDDPGSLLAGAVEVLDTSKWGTYFEAPVGTDMDATDYLGAFEYVGIYAMAMKDGTVVTIEDKNGNHVDSATINEGESYNNVVLVGYRITSTEPVQVHILAGDIDSNFEMRWYSLLPVEHWSTTYLSPVGDGVGNTRIVVYNPTDTQRTIYYKIGENGPDLPLLVGANAANRTTVIDTGKGAYLWGTEPFIALSMTDTKSKGQIFDWGYPVQPINGLTHQVLVGWGYGCTGNTCTEHTGETEARSVVWISPVEDAWCFTDFDGDKEVDEAYFVHKYSSRQIMDPDQDMSGAVIQCFDSYVDGTPVNFAAAWGQDPARSFSNDDDALDLGTTVPPYPSQICTKYQVNGDTVFDRCTNSDGTFDDTLPVPGTCTTDCEPVTIPPPAGGGGASGDPHIKRWNRKPFQFHGECDLVLVHSDHVNGDKPLDVHIRTTIKQWWSQVESAAMRVGEAVVEMATDKIIIDGKEYHDEDLPVKTAEFTVKPPVVGDAHDPESRLYEVELTDHSKISFKVIKEFMNVFVAGSVHDFERSVGLMGDFYLGKPYNRAGERMRDLEAFAFEWQVDPAHDPLLFAVAREPQLPREKCRMPTEVSPRARKLRENTELLKQAQEACSHSSDAEWCVDDIMNTGRLELAGAW